MPTCIVLVHNILKNEHLSMILQDGYQKRNLFLGFGKWRIDYKTNDLHIFDHSPLSAQLPFEERGVNRCFPGCCLSFGESETDALFEEKKERAGQVFVFFL